MQYRRYRSLLSLGDAAELPGAKRWFPGGAADIASVIQSSQGPPCYIQDGELRIKEPEFLIWLAEYAALKEARHEAAAARKRLPKRGPVVYAETDIFEALISAPVTTSNDNHDDNDNENENESDKDTIELAN